MRSRLPFLLRTAFPFGTALALVFGVAACQKNAPTPPALPIPPGADSSRAAPDTARALRPGEAMVLAAPTLAGDTLDLASLRGKVVLVNFWATWCAPCRQETPALVALRESLKAQGFEVVGVSLDLEGKEAVQPFVDEFRVPYPMLLGDQTMADRLGGAYGLPTSFLLDREGNLIRRFTGVVPVAMLRPLLAELLAEAPTP